MMVALVTHTPEPTVWRYTMRQIMERVRALPALMPLINPFAAGDESEKQKPLTDPDAIRMTMRMIGVKSR